MNLVDLTELLAGYEAAKQTLETPMAAKGLTIEGEELVLAVMHPDAFKRIMDNSVVDPRSTDWSDLDG